MTSHEELVRSMFLRRTAPVLCEAAAEIGSLQIRTRGTIGGNVVNASPAADLVPALHVLEAVLVLRTRKETRRLPIGELATGPQATCIRPDELLVEVRFARPALDEFQRFAKLGQRKALACAKLSLAFRSRWDGIALRGVRVAFGAVAPTVIRARRVEAVLEGAPPTNEVLALAVAEAEAEVSPIDDIRSTADYRRAACSELLRRALASCYA